MPKQYPRVAVIVVNWNRKDLTAETIESLLADGYPNLQIIVVDNGSSDGSAEYLDKRFPRIRQIKYARNLGFALGNNQGIEVALASNADYIFFLNNDATVNPGAIHTLVELLEQKPEVGAVGPFIVYSKEPDKIWFGGGLVSLWSGAILHLHIRQRFEPGKYQARPTEYITGCAFMARARLIKELGGFDPEYLLYSEDVDLSLRFRKAGWSLWVTPEAIVKHQVSASTGGGITPLKSYYRARSTALLLKRWAPWWGWVGLPLLGTVGALAMTARLIMQFRWRAVLPLWRGVIGGILGLKPAKRYRLGK